MSDLVAQKIWIALVIGNSRYHWAWFLHTKLQSSWDTVYFTTDIITQMMSANPSGFSSITSLPIELQAELADRQIAMSEVPIYLVSVVPNQTLIWQQLPQVKQITLDNIPLINLYPTFGIDRALSILGAGESYGYPALVIDGGTALTITGVDNHLSLVGGAIMPGLRLQFRSLSTSTAALPEVELLGQLPSRWSNNTHDAIASGILHTIISGIRDFVLDWERLFPDSQIVFTGGDGAILAGYLQLTLPEQLVRRIVFDRELLFRGVAEIVSKLP
jgi:type III pantothenate kinase